MFLKSSFPSRILVRLATTGRGFSMTYKHKGFSVAAVLLAVLALPSVASSAPELTHPTGTRLPVGTPLQLTNVGEMKPTDPSGSILYSCTRALLTGELVKNNGSEVEATITKAEFTGTGGCTSTLGGITVTTGGANGVPWCLRATPLMAADEFQIRGGKCSEAPRKISYALDGAANCTYTRSEPLKGTFTTDTGVSPSDGVMQLVSQAFTKESGIGFLCPTEYKWDFTFTLETDKGLAEPLYFS
jgi:hypothetical protein